MRRLLRALCLLAAAPGVLLAGAAQGTDGRASLAEDAARFRALRRELREDVDRQRPDLRRWDGPLHRLMSDLGARIERGRYGAKRAVALLGEPDEVVPAGGRHGTVRVPKDETHLVYWWRGGHDYLYLVVRRGRVVGSRWWFAME